MASSAAAVKPAITRTAIGDAALKAAVRGIVHQAVVAAPTCAGAAALASDGLREFTGDAAWAVVVAPAAVLHVRSARGSAATLAVPRLGCEPPGAGPALSVIAYRVAHDDPVEPARGAAGGGALSSAPERGALVAVHRSTFDSAEELARATALVLAARAAFCLGPASEAAVAGGVRAALTAAFGSTWGCVLCPEEGAAAAGARRTPAVALPLTCRRRLLECTLLAAAAPAPTSGRDGGSCAGGSDSGSVAPFTASGSGGSAAPTAAAAAAALSPRPSPPSPPPPPPSSYRLLAYQLPPSQPRPLREGGWGVSAAEWRGYVGANAWVLGRMALYALAAACLSGYFAFGHALSSRCARGAGDEAAAGAASGGWAALLGGGGAPAAASAAADAPRGEPPAGCSVADSLAAEARLRLVAPLMYGGLGALALLSALRLLHGWVQRQRMKALLTRLAAAGAAMEAVRAVGDDAPAVGAAGGAAAAGGRRRKRA